MSCNRECFDKAHASFGRDDCAICPGRDDGAHKPDPNEAARTARASGSPAASSPDSLGTSVHSSPPFSGSGVASIRHPCGACRKCTDQMRKDAIFTHEYILCGGG